MFVHHKIIYVVYIDYIHGFVNKVVFFYMTFSEKLLSPAELFYVCALFDFPTDYKDLT